jgi:hypothetical protein
MFGQGGINLILCDRMDGEAVSVSLLIQAVFSKKVNWIEGRDFTPADFATLSNGKVRRAVFMLSQATHNSVTQLVRFGILVKETPSEDMMPVVNGVAFGFHDHDFLFKLQTGKALDLGSDPDRVLQAVAGSMVSRKAITDGLVHDMTFLVIIIDEHTNYLNPSMYKLYQ